jgi:hypothetical protein
MTRISKEQSIPLTRTLNVNTSTKVAIDYNKHDSTKVTLWAHFRHVSTINATTTVFSVQVGLKHPVKYTEIKTLKKAKEVFTLEINKPK